MGRRHELRRHVCDTEGVILYMNEKARATYIRHGNLIGSNLFGCHNERSRETIRRLTAEGGFERISPSRNRESAR